MNTFRGILIGVILVFGVQFALEVRLLHIMNSPSITSYCSSWKGSVYWNWESMTFGSRWNCLAPHSN